MKIPVHSDNSFFSLSLFFSRSKIALFCSLSLLSISLRLGYLLASTEGFGCGGLSVSSRFVSAQISNMKKRLSSIVREYKFDSVQAFYKEFDAAKKENLEYQAARAEYDKIYFSLWSYLAAE